jgi:nucleoside-diphosphate-sugar epimerase
MKLVVTGGTGFTGERVVRLLAAQGTTPTVVVRPASERSWLAATGATEAIGDLNDAASLERAFYGHDTLIHVASMGFGQIPGVVQAAIAAGIRRAVFVSTTAVLTRLPVRSKPVRAAAEDCVRRSGIDWTIVRPTMIYGSDRDRNMCRLLKHLHRWRMVPIPGRGDALQQPVHVDDVAATIVAAASSPTAIGGEYNISGAAPLTLRQLLTEAAAAVGVRPILVPIPSRATARLLAAFERLGVPFPLRSEQIARLSEDKAFDHHLVRKHLGVHPRSFADGIREEAAAIGLGEPSP